MDADAVIARLASERYGTFTQRAALAEGVTRRQLQWRVRRGVVAVLEPGVYRVAGAPPCWEQRVIAAVDAEAGFASHRTAAALWKLDGFRPGIVEVLTARWKRRPNRSFRLHETSLLPDADTTEVRGIPVTSKSRTIVDLAAVVPAHRVEQALDTHGVDVGEVWECLERLTSRGRPWVEVVRRLALVRLPTQGLRPNRFEQQLYEVLRRAGLPLPEAQVEIRGPDGTLIARVDWCFRTTRVILECDSYEQHGQWVRRKSDLRRDRRLTALGYRVLRFSWEDVTERCDDVVRDVEGALAAASA